MSALATLVEDLKRQAAIERVPNSDYSKGLYEGAALAYETAARLLERAMLVDGLE